MDSPTVPVVITHYIPHYIMHNISTLIFYNHGQDLQLSWIAAHLDFGCFHVTFYSYQCLFSPGKSSVELAVTGTGLPVVLVPHPSHDFDFGNCIEGQQVDLLCVLQNFCSVLPIIFRFQKLAHFSTEPSTGKIPPGQCQVKLFNGLMMC